MTNSEIKKFSNSSTLFLFKADIFKSLKTRRSFKKHLIVLEDEKTRTKNPKTFNRIYYENLITLENLEEKLREKIILFRKLKELKIQ